ncbi:MAG: hypothetical protein ACREI3_04115, partial [Nitrospirales bacterium]
TTLVIPSGQAGLPVTLSGTRAGTITLTAAAEGYASGSSIVTITDTITKTEEPGPASAPPGRDLSGLVLSAADATPLAGVRLLLAGRAATTDADGRFVFTGPPSGYQLVKVDHLSLDSPAGG